MKILLDNGIFSHAEFMRPDVQERRISWGDVVTVLPVHGFRRKEPHNDPEYQRQIDALFTVGRLIREDRIEAYNYDEIAVEGYRGAAKFPACNALRACKVHHCPPPLTRSKFRSTTNLMESGDLRATSIIDQLRRLVEYCQARKRHPRREQAREHLAIIGAIASQDMLKAAALLRAHLEDARRKKSTAAFFNSSL